MKMAYRNKPREVIYLIPLEDGENFVWCYDAAPGVGMKESDAIKYIREDSMLSQCEQSDKG